MLCTDFVLPEANNRARALQRPISSPKLARNLTIDATLVTPLPSPSSMRRAASCRCCFRCPHSGRDYPDWLIELARRRASRRSTTPRGPAGRPAGLARAQARLRRGDRPDAAGRGRLQPRRGRRRPVGDRRRRARAGDARGRAAGSASSRRGRSSTASCGGGRSRPAQLDDRLDQAHRPYHRAIEERSSACCSTASAARCCSIATRCRRRRRALPPIIFGDRRGRTADAWVSRAAVRCGAPRRLRGRAQRSLRRRPRHRASRAVRRRGVHALQLEIDRRCYLDATLREPGPGFDRTARVHRAVSPSSLAKRCSAASSRPPPNEPDDLGLDGRGRSCGACAGALPCCIWRPNTSRICAQREEMGVDERQHAVLVHLAQLVAAKVRAASPRRPSGSRDRRTAARSPSGWIATSPSISRSALISSSMNAAVRWPAASNCSQNWRIALVASLGWSPSNSGSPSSKSPTASDVGSKHSDSSSLSGRSRASRNG